jgi:hypothetical protein
MLSFGRLRASTTSGGHALRAVHGRVDCPRRGDLDADACVECEWLVDVAGDDELHLVCSWVPQEIASFDELRRPLG